MTKLKLKLTPSHTQIKESEDQVKESIFRFLHLHKIFCWRNNSTGVFDPTKKIFRRPSKWHKNGVPDILGILPDGKFLGIECKATKKHLSEHQIKFFADAHQNSNGKAILIEADSLEKVRNNERLKEYLNGNQKENKSD